MAESPYNLKPVDLKGHLAKMFGTKKTKKTTAASGSTGGGNIYTAEEVGTLLDKANTHEYEKRAQKAQIARDHITHVAKTVGSLPAQGGTQVNATVDKRGSAALNFTKRTPVAKPKGLTPAQKAAKTRADNKAAEQRILKRQAASATKPKSSAAASRTTKATNAARKPVAKKPVVKPTVKRGK